MLAGIVYLCAVRAILRKPTSLQVRTILLIALACRLVLIPSQPLFDDDIYRYIWDGKVFAHGFNPFIHAPASESLSFLRDANWAKVNYPDVRTIYPPVAQLIFGFLHLLGLGSVVGIKVAFLLFDVGTMLAVTRLLDLLGRPRSWVLIYAWSPLAMKEFANSGHLEPVILLPLLLAVYCWVRRKPNESIGGVWLGLSAMVKLFPVLLMPLAFRMGRWKSVGWSMTAMIVLSLPFVGAGSRAFSGAVAYSRYWEFNDGAFALLASGERHLFGFGPGTPVWISKLLVAVIVAAYSIYSVHRLNPMDRVGVIQTARNLLALLILLAPTANPWYVCWLLPFLAVVPNSGLLLLCVSCNLSYLYYVSLSFPHWIPMLEYLPVYLVLMIEYLRARPLPRRERSLTAGGSDE
jgi:hypothetical protein